jgi:hypothetical protein
MYMAPNQSDGNLGFTYFEARHTQRMGFRFKLQNRQIYIAIPYYRAKTN